MYKWPAHVCLDKIVQNNLNTVKSVLICHLWDKNKWPFKADDLLKEVQSM